MKRIGILSLLLVFGFLGITSCKNKDSKEIVEGKTTQTKVFESNEEDSLVQITLNTNDKLKYDIEKIIVYEGQTIQLTLHHTGSMPVTAMGHNFVVKDNNISLFDFGEKAMRSVNTEYIPEENVIVGSNTLGGGESTILEFKAPSKGSYDYLCTFTGHYPVMNGTLIVK